MMKFMPNVTGSAAQAVPLIVGIDTVYVHSNIKEIEVEISEGEFQTQYQYDEYQYTKDEYIKKLSEEATSLMLASAETYETMYLENTNLMLAIAEIYESMNGGAV